jgi:hypothetical protein
LFDDGTEIKIKAATDFHTGFFLDPVCKYGCPCLFPDDGTNPNLLTENVTGDIEIVACQIISDHIPPIGQAIMISKTNTMYKIGN